MRRQYCSCSNRGFTLMEMMVVVVIIAILVSLAYPSYTEYVQRSRVSEATSTLADLRVRMERIFQDNRTYLNGAVCGVRMPEGNAFRFTCDNATAAAYTLTATGIGSMNGFVFTVSETGLRRTTSFLGRVENRNCWMMRRGDSC